MLGKTQAPGRHSIHPSLEGTLKVSVRASHKQAYFHKQSDEQDPIYLPGQGKADSVCKEWAAHFTLQFSTMGAQPAIPF